MSKETREEFFSDKKVQLVISILLLFFIASFIIEQSLTGNLTRIKKPGVITEVTNMGRTPQCNDNIDNDQDSLKDYPEDYGCTSLSDTSESDTLNQGLQAYWKFDNNVLDSAGNNHGTIIGAPSYTLGKKNQAISFPTSVDSVDVGTGTLNLAANNEVTVAYWFNIQYNDPGNFYENVINRANVQPFSITNEGNSNKVRTIIRTNSGTSYLRSNQLLNLNQWYHVTLTYKNGLHEIYIDGLPENSAVWNGILSVSSTDKTTMGGGLNGLIDEVRIYNRILNTVEIGLLANALTTGGTGICGDTSVQCPNSQNVCEICDPPGSTTSCTTSNNYPGSQSCLIDCTGYNTCTTTLYCGDGSIDGLEQCDDNNQVSGDGCSSTCIIEPGWICSGEPSVCSPAPECSDTFDNDGDGAVDGADFACQQGGTNENSYLAECQNQIDDDGDGNCDFDGALGQPGCSGIPDADCSSLQDNDESTQQTQMCSSVSQWGITWTFDKQYPCGQFVNGDWWVVGPVKIVSKTPAASSGRNGDEINPKPEIVGQTWGQPYDSRVTKYNSSFQADFSQPIPRGSSIVSTISNPNTNTCTIGSAIGWLGPAWWPQGQWCSQGRVNSVAVLTVLSSPAPADAFRPPYAGTNKPLYSSTNIQNNLQPIFLNLPQITSAPPLSYVEQRFQMANFDHMSPNGGNYRYMRPSELMQDYAADSSMDVADAVLRFMMNDPWSAKQRAIINFVQSGIDIKHMVDGGLVFVPGAGQGNGRKMLVVFAALALNDPSFKAVAGYNNQVWHEDQEIWWSTIANNGKGQPLFGDDNSEYAYWQYIATGQGSGARDTRDPYGYVDALGYLECCNSVHNKPYALALALVPELAQIWNYPSSVDPYFVSFVDRWVNFGRWMLPDPCAPWDGSIWPQNYGITYGPDPNNPGKCILGSGRFPTQHGTNKDSGNRVSQFAIDMWSSHYPYSCDYDGVCEPGLQETCTNCMDCFCGSGLSCQSGQCT